MGLLLILSAACLKTAVAALRFLHINLQVQIFAKDTCPDGVGMTADYGYVHLLSSMTMTSTLQMTQSRAFQGSLQFDVLL